MAAAEIDRQKDSEQEPLASDSDEENYRALHPLDNSIYAKFLRFKRACKLDPRCGLDYEAEVSSYKKAERWNASFFKECENSDINKMFPFNRDEVWN